MLIKLYMLISLVFEDTKIEQDIYQAINSSFPQRIKFRQSKYLSQLNSKISQDSFSQKTSSSKLVKT